MASAPTPDVDAALDEFLTDRGHDTEPVTWQQDYNKKQCPDCGGLHDLSANTCSVCGWEPGAH